MQVITVYQTKTFKDIFTDYDSFSDWYADCGLSDDETDIPAKKTFQLIFNEYADSHVAYDEEGFKNHFANDLYTYYKEFEATTKSISELMNLTDDQIAIGQTMIMNVADIPETTSSTDVETVDFINNQQKTISKKGVLQIKREQLSNKRTLTVKTFLNRFRHLFIKILSPAFTTVFAEDDEEA